MNIIINIIISFHHDHCCYINPEKNFPQGILLEIDEDFTDEELDGIMAEVDVSHLVHRNHWWTPPCNTVITWLDRPM